MSFAIEPGQVAAFVGPTGAGKTTIISLIPRFYDPVSGVVKIDGVDVRRFKQRSLREPDQFRAAGDRAVPGDDLAQHRLWKTGREPRGNLHAAEVANASEFIEKMPNGLRHHGRRARRHALGRTAAAHRHRPRGDSQYSDSDPGRTEFGTGRGIGKAGLRGAGPA